MYSKAVALSFFAYLTTSLPTGSPVCDINGPRFQGAHGSETAAGFSITVQPQSVLGEYNIVVSKQNNPIHGVLIYVVAGGKATHVGTFAPKRGFKNVASCTGATITHSDDTEKTDTTFKWTAPSAIGIYEVKAVVLGKNGKKFQWQSLSTAFGIPDDTGLVGPPAPKVTPAKVTPPEKVKAKKVKAKEIKAKVTPPKEIKASSLPCAKSEVAPHASVPTETPIYEEVPKYDEAMPTETPIYEEVPKDDYTLPETTQYEEMNPELSGGFKLTVAAVSVLAVLLAC